MEVLADIQEEEGKAIAHALDLAQHLKWANKPQPQKRSTRCHKRSRDVFDFAFFDELQMRLHDGDARLVFNVALSL